ncbi:MAG: electron transfer flavoprotein subunit beta [Chloroflexi bacterium]|mgnify:FL=1|jgi:electron transfer flavoprotein alpha subunit|nr:electron transfer flavoprotein subunit beta [Chloroflexota bacterium]MBT7081539.1 electron transfer flavoprotein subunit beta [Chloroflexota bacterium]MBT7289360.1 electron transfer flavoprotein subunit beta [Chloroflexota bacterium]
MNYIVLIKQVPDIRHIPKEAWDWEKGTLKRGLLDNVCNELDKQAMAMALSMRKDRDGKIIALTMGPPFATEILRYAMSIGIDEGVLITDRKFAGADTTATAYPLAQAIRKIQKEIFAGSDDFVVLAGMQSVDGDTAQVPPQLAEELGIANISYVTTVTFEKDNMLAERITRRGAETVSPTKMPCLLTVTEWAETPFPSFARTRWAEKETTREWSVEDIEADTTRVGLGGSRTNVVKIFSPKESSNRVCIFEHDLNKVVQGLKETYNKKLNEISSEAVTSDYKLPEGKQSDYKGDVCVYVEQDDGEIHPATYELLGKAAELAATLGEKVGAVLVGSNVKGLSDALISYGADKVFVIDNPLLAHFLPTSYTKAISRMVEQHEPQIMLFSATPQGRELAPRIAYKTNSGLTADCTQLDIVDFTRGKKEATAILKQTRPALGGNIMASIVSQNSKVQMTTARPGVFAAIEPDSTRKGEVIDVVVEITEDDLGAKIVTSELLPSTSELSDATIIVGGGKGLRTKEGFDKYIHPLVEGFEQYFGEQAMAGASRMAVESGFIERTHQVGQTGQTVKPTIYVAVGISGAIQHVTGMQSSDIIIAINRDPDAAIFKVADFGIVGDLEEVVPGLIKALKTSEVQQNV